MAISAFFEAAASGESRGTARRTLHLETSGRAASGGDASVLIHNASETGLLIETAADLDEGERIEVDLPEAGPTEARVVWSSGTLHGCRFEAPIAKGALSAAELRSVVGGPAPASRSRDVSPAGFGHRFQQLRKARGLTLSNLADALSVSKPTVWAWEHGKARPVEGRLPAIAEALGVAPEELEPENGAMVPADLVDRCRAQIAQAANLPLSCVRILIEL